MIDAIASSAPKASLSSIMVSPVLAEILRHVLFNSFELWICIKSKSGDVSLGGNFSIKRRLIRFVVAAKHCRDIASSSRRFPLESILYIQPCRRV